MNRWFVYIKNIIRTYYVLFIQNINRRKNDASYLKSLYKKRIGNELNLTNPKLFTEKLQYLKLLNINKNLTIYSDKYLSHEYVKEKAGNEITTKILGIFDQFFEIDWEKLHDRTIMIKCNHDSHSAYKVLNPSVIDCFFLNWLFSLQLKVDYYLLARERNYQNVNKKIIIEEYIDGLKWDLKFFVLNKMVRVVQVDDLNRKKRSFYKIEKEADYRMVPIPLFVLKKIKDVTMKICPNVPFCRLDYMASEDKVIFTEFTFYPAAGFYHYPENLDRWLGEQLNIREMYPDAAY